MRNGGQLEAEESDSWFSAGFCNWCSPCEDREPTVLTRKQLENSSFLQLVHRTQQERTAAIFTQGGQNLNFWICIKFNFSKQLLRFSKCVCVCACVAWHLPVCSGNKHSSNIHSVTTLQLMLLTLMLLTPGVFPPQELSPHRTRNLVTNLGREGGVGSLRWFNSSNFPT